MFLNYFKIAFRSVFKNKVFSIINITGLAIGMTVCLLMLMYVVNELSYENFHNNEKNIYRIALDWGTSDSKMRFAGSLPALAPALEEGFAEIKKAVRIRKDYEAIITDQNGQQHKELNLFYSDPSVFEIFSFTLLAGDKKSALIRPMTMVISESMAKKYFANNNPLGQVLHYNDSFIEITGLMKDIPANTHLRCDFLVSYTTLKALGDEPAMPWNNWGDDFTYIMVHDNAEIKDLSEKMDQLLLKNTNEWFASRMAFVIQPIKDIHWDLISRGDLGPKGNIMYIYIFLSAAIFVLFIACFNYINLSTSKLFDRMKEIGVRKVIGATRLHLVKQFLTESFLVIVFSILVGIVLFEILHPYFFSYLDSQIVFKSFYFFYLSSIVFGLIIIVALFAGGYPSLLLSRFRPIETISGNVLSETKRSLLRKILVITQFAISIILILGAVIIHQQLYFMKNSDLGFDKEDVLLINVPFSNTEVKQKYPAVRDELLKLSTISSVSSAYTVPGINSRMNMSVILEGQPSDNSINIQVLPADYGFLQSMDLELIHGRDFSKDEKSSVILNQSAVSTLGLKSPVGKKLKLPGDEKSREIIGVVKDFHIQSLHNKINPMLIYLNTEMQVVIAIRLLPGNHQETIASVKKIWANILPGIDFNYQFLKDSYDQLYDSEEKTGKLFTVFTVLAILISSMGLFGLSSLMIGRRTKEIGIRKVVGASVQDILMMLIKNFTIWVLIANVFAWPVAWYVLNKWLQNFAYRIDISVWPYVLAGFITLTIALITVSWQAIRAAISNPVEALRYE